MYWQLAREGMAAGRRYLTERLTTPKFYQKGPNPDLWPFEQWAIANKVIVKPTLIT